jgi:hypothetical protein
VLDRQPELVAVHAQEDPFGLERVFVTKGLEGACRQPVRAKANRAAEDVARPVMSLGGRERVR